MEVTAIFGLHITYLPPLHPGSSEPLAYLLTPRRHRQCNGCNGLLWLTVLTIHTGYWSQLAHGDEGRCEAKRPFEDAARGMAKRSAQPRSGTGYRDAAAWVPEGVSRPTAQLTYLPPSASGGLRPPAYLLTL